MVKLSYNIQHTTYNMFTIGFSNQEMKERKQAFDKIKVALTDVIDRIFVKNFEDYTFEMKEFYTIGIEADVAIMMKNMNPDDTKDIVIKMYLKSLYPFGFSEDHCTVGGLCIKDASEIASIMYDTLVGAHRGARVKAPQGVGSDPKHLVHPMLTKASVVKALREVDEGLIDVNRSVAERLGIPFTDGIRKICILNQQREIMRIIKMIENYHDDRHSEYFMRMRYLAVNYAYYGDTISVNGMNASELEKTFDVIYEAVMSNGIVE
jgi:hypothetical protein